MKNTDKKIKIVNCSNLSLIDFDCNGDLLLVGNFNGICGNETQANKINIMTILKTLKNGYKVYAFGGVDTINHIGKLINDWNKKIKIGDAKYLRSHYLPMNFDKYSIKEIIPEIKRKFKSMGKIKNMIVNPPYKRDLHLDFFKTCLGNLSGKMVIIEPATWLINVRKNGNASEYDEIKEIIDGHVKSVVIENFNKDFGIGLYVPLSITNIDMSYDGPITFNCCGETKIVRSIYDCNLIGDYRIIWNIFDKVMSYGNMVNKHITNYDMGNQYWYVKYDDILSFGIEPAPGLKNYGRSNSYKNDNNYVNTKFGEYSYSYIQSIYHRIVGIVNEIPKRIKGGSTYEKPVYSDKNADCIYGTKYELENWKHFIFNNKLPLFLNIVLTIDQNNVSQEFIPWLVDKQYTDEEINEKFGFTEDEIKLMDDTLKKFERNSPWFKRYMCGEDSVSDDDINTFIQEISK